MSAAFFTRNSKGFYEINSAPKKITAACVGRALNNIDYEKSRGEIRAAERELLCSAAGLAEKDILSLEQVHGCSVLTVDARPSAPADVYGTADALITQLPGVCLVIRTADCVPVLIADKKAKAVGAVHSGWKGTRLGISGAAAALIKERCGCAGDDLLAYILPSIGPESYEVKEDVAQHFPEQTIRRNGRLYVNLWAAVEASLRAQGIPDENIFNTGICNRINTDEFFSHRYGDKGRNLNFIFIHD
ncbi:MAG: polyphenol oxidase family protein [Spirochaetia bacterium]|jgi:YfiH family protein|nr:polyphenol oxidase family protein [Spirochaetia bacterium]